jgi:hypothetical protein
MDQQLGSTTEERAEKHKRFTDIHGQTRGAVVIVPGVNAHTDGSRSNSSPMVLPCMPWICVIAEILMASAFMSKRLKTLSVTSSIGPPGCASPCAITDTGSIQRN